MNSCSACSPRLRVSTRKRTRRGVGVLEQPVDLRDRGEGLAGPRSHLDERAGPVGLQRSLEFGDGLNLALAQAGRVERRERGDTCPKRHPCLRMGLERRRTVEGEDLPGSRIRVAAVREPRDLSRALVEKRQRLGIGHPLELGVGVPFRLLLDGRDPFAPGIRLGFDDADGLPVAEEDVVGGAGVGRVLAHCDARSGAEVDGIPVVHVPARRPEAIVYAVARNLLGSLVDIVWHAVTVRHARP